MRAGRFVALPHPVLTAQVAHLAEGDQSRKFYVHVVDHFGQQGVVEREFDFPFAKSPVDVFDRWCVQTHPSPMAARSDVGHEMNVTPRV